MRHDENFAIVFSTQIFESVIVLPLNVSIIIKECCFFGYLFSAFVFSRKGNIMSSKNSTDFSVLDQWFFVKFTEKELGKSNLGRHRRDFPW